MGGSYIDKFERKGLINSEQRPKMNVIVDENREPMVLKKSDINLAGKNLDQFKSYIGKSNSSELMYGPLTSKERTPVNKGGSSQHPNKLQGFSDYENANSSGANQQRNNSQKPPVRIKKENISGHRDEIYSDNLDYQENRR